jgi:HicB family
MELEPYIETIRRQLEVAAEAGGEDARSLAERLLAPLEAAIRLALQDALADAAEEITLELAPGSVELRLRGRDLEFVVALPPTGPSADSDAGAGDVTSADWLRRTEPKDGAEGDDGVARINLRLPERLKARVEQAAADEGLSVNSWLVRSAVSAVERNGPIRQREPRTPHGAQRYRGWAR